MLYTAIIVEPREHKAFPYVFENFLNNLSDDWSFIIFHGNLNLEFILKIIYDKLSKHIHRISLIQLNVDNLTIEEYSNLLKYNKDFYKYIPTEIFLVFQTDSIILTKYKHLINNFLHYDYVGAPWKHHISYSKNECIGNGGLSIRKKSKMLEIMEKQGKSERPEDIYFSCYDSVLISKPTYNDASFFSIEEVFNDSSFGCHKPWALYDNKCLLYNTFEEVKELYKYNDIPPPVMKIDKQPITTIQITPPTMPIIPFMPTSPKKKIKQKYNLSSLLFQNKFTYKK